MQKLNGSNLKLTNINRIRCLPTIKGRVFPLLNKEEENHQYEIPNSVKAQTFWRGVWSERKEHDKDAEWLKDVKKELEQDEDQNKIDIIKDKMMRVMRRTPNWKTPGPYNVQG